MLLNECVYTAKKIGGLFDDDDDDDDWFTPSKTSSLPTSQPKSLSTAEKAKLR